MKKLLLLGVLFASLLAAPVQSAEPWYAIAFDVVSAPGQQVRYELSSAERQCDLVTGADETTPITPDELFALFNKAKPGTVTDKDPAKKLPSGIRLFEIKTAEQGGMAELVQGATQCSHVLHGLQRRLPNQMTDRNEKLKEFAQPGSGPGGRMTAEEYSQRVDAYYRWLHTAHPELPYTTTCTQSAGPFDPLMARQFPPTYHCTTR